MRSGHSRSARLSRRNSKEKLHGLCSLGVQIAPLREVLLAGQMPQPGSPPTTAGNAASLASRPGHCLLPHCPACPGQAAQQAHSLLSAQHEGVVRGAQAGYSLGWHLLPELVAGSCYLVFSTGSSSTFNRDAKAGLDIA